MPTRFYIDADVLGLGKALANIRDDVTYPGFPGGLGRDKRMRPPCPVASTDVPDTVWIPEVAREGWVIITRDGKIARRRAELAAVRDSSARMVALSGREALTVWDQLVIVAARWDDLERLTIEPGPFIYTATSRRLRPVPL